MSFIPVMENLSHIGPYRMTSPILQKLPFMTSAVTKNAELRHLVDEDQSLLKFKQFLTQVDDYDASLFSRSGRDSLLQMRKTLCLEVSFPPHTGSFPQIRLLFVPPCFVNKSDSNNFCCLMTAYRLADIMASLSQVTLASAAAFPRKNFHRDPPLAHFKKLKNWVNVLDSFCTATQSLTASASWKAGGNVQLGLFKFLYQVNGKKDACKILTNIVTAAWHINFLVVHPFQKGEMPHLTTCSDLLTEMVSSGSALTDDEAAYFNTLVEDSQEDQVFRLPLQLALGVSPLYLLLPNKLCRKDGFGRQAIINTFIGLGNEKPQVLKEVEKVIWSVLFSLADGTTDPTNAMSTLNEAIPWDSVRGCSLTDRMWFDIIPTAKPSAMAQKDGRFSASHTVPQDISSSSLDQADIGTKIKKHPRGVNIPPEANSEEVSSSAVQADVATAIDEIRTPPEPNPAGATETDDDIAQELGTSEAVAVGHVDKSAYPPRGVSTSLVQSKNPPAASGPPVPSIPGPRKPLLPPMKRKSSGRKPREGNRSDSTTSATVVTPRKRKRSGSSEETLNTRKRVVHFTLALGGGESRENPINLEEYLLTQEAEQMSFPCDKKRDLTGPAPKRYTLKRSLNMWDARHESVKKSFEVHHEADATHLEKLIVTVEKNYIGGRAKHVATPEKSVFRIMSRVEYDAMGPSGLADILKRQHIVVKDICKKDNLRFDEAGLRTLSPLHAGIEMQDLSLPSGAEGINRLIGGTVEQLLQVSRDPHGRVLNALDFPLHAMPVEHLPCSVDLVAWNEAAEMNYEDRKEGFPLTDTRWGLAGLRGAFTLWHLDSDGFNSFVDIKNEEGEKLWIVANVDRDRSGQLQLLLNANFELETGPSDFPLEAILLTKGTRLIMRSNTLHAVLTPEHTICHGGHFYCTKTMQDTAAGLMHAFICHKYITNTSHPPSWHLLRRILYFYHQGLVKKLFSPTSSEFEHLPQLPSLIGEKGPVYEALNLLSLCNLIMLANALDPRTYADNSSPEKQTANTKFDYNAIPFKDRRGIWQSRGVCLDIFRWFRQHYTVLKQGTEIDLVSVYLVHQASALLIYKHEADRREYASMDGCTVTSLMRQIDAAVEMDEAAQKLWISCPVKREVLGGGKRLSSLEDCLLLLNLDQYEVVSLGSVDDWKDSGFGDGLTRLDHQYLAGRKWFVEMEKCAMAALSKTGF